MERLFGSVRKFKAKEGYGFVCADAHGDKQFFFRVEHVQGGKRPEKDSPCWFTPVFQNVPGKNDRAVNVEVV